MVEVLVKAAPIQAVSREPEQGQALHFTFLIRALVDNRDMWIDMDR